MRIVYILKSTIDPGRYYIGVTQDLNRRVKEHNSEASGYAKRYAPWDVETYSTFKNDILAENFEQYLKSGSGNAFLKRHFLQAKQNGGLKGSAKQNT